jgi:hypothetical protein
MYPKRKRPGKGGVANGKIVKNMHNQKTVILHSSLSALSAWARK